MTTLSYGISKVNYIRQALHGYVGSIAIISELLQNADDAKATHVSFHFQPDALEVHNNSIFSDQDFTNIPEIASGGKRNDEEKIGTWGTGFLSVFHITDYPELMSSGKHIVFDPKLDRLPVLHSAVTDSTVFRLPWRCVETELAQNWNAKIWTDEDIRHLQEKMLQTLYGLMLFLRHIQTIEVFKEAPGQKPQLMLRVAIREETVKQLEFGNRRNRMLEYRDIHQVRTDEWLFYRGSVPAHQLPKGVMPKDRKVEIAFPRKTTDWLKKNLPGTLYNFLPTPILTGFPFQVNGSFFPDNYRSNILLDESTQPEKARWNHTVIAALGDLFANAVEDMRDQIQEPTRFYEVLPLKQPTIAYLNPIRERFVREANDRAIVFHSQGAWGTPRAVYIGRSGSTLPQLVANELPVVSGGTPRSFSEFLTGELAVPQLDWKLIAGLLISKGLKPDMRLSQAPTMINTRDKLEKLYTELQVYKNEVAASELLQLLPLCLDQTDILRRFRNDGVRRGDTTERKLLGHMKVRFMDATLQEKYPSLLNELVPEVCGADAVEALAAESWLARPLTLDSIKGKFVANFDHLAELLKFIQRDLNHVNADLLAKLPIVRDADDRLFCPVDEAVYFNKPISVLRRLGYTFLHPHFADDPDILAVYRKAKNLPLSPTAVVKQLHKLPELLAQKSSEEKINLLTKLYQYFLKTPEPLSPQDELGLRGIPLCITSKGNLRPANDGKTVLHLHSSSRDTSPELEHLNKLQLDNVVDHRLMTDDSGRFLTEVLGIEVLSTENLIGNVIVNHYHDPQINVDARRDLLHYIGIQLQQLPIQTQSQLTEKLTDKRLIECQDGVYRCGKEVYFLSPELEELFPHGYSTPHADYGISLDNGTGANGQSQWHWLFYKLGVNEHAQADHIIKAIREIVEYTPPAEVYINRLRPLYQYLRGTLGSSIKVDDPNVRQLATIPWLPASNDHKRWFRPSEIYPSRLRELIGVQAPLLAFQDPTEQLNEVLNMPVNPPTELVVNHLRTLAKQKQGVSVRLYAFLEQHHTEVPVGELKREAIIWDPKEQRFWKPDQVFFGDLSHRFGARRGYFKAPGGEFQGFLERLGIRSSFDMQDSIKLIEEIADEYGVSTPLSDKDRLLLSIHFDELSHSGLIPELKRLVKRPIVPDAKSYLHLPERIAINNWPDALQQFTEDDIPTVHEHFVTHTVLTKLDVKPLTSIIQRTAENAQFVEDTHHLELRLRQLSKAFRRIALKEQQNGFRRDASQPDPGEQFQQVHIRLCKRLEVSYSLDNQQGWKVKGRRRDEQALYDLKMKNTLYIQQTGKHGVVSIGVAHELVRALFPGMPTSHLSPIVEGVLDRVKESIDAVDRYLDGHHCPRLHNEENSLHDQVINTSLGLTEWEEYESSTSEFESAARIPISPSANPQRIPAKQVSLFDATNLSVLTEPLPNQTREQELLVTSKPETVIARPTILPVPQMERTIETPVESGLSKNIHIDISVLDGAETGSEARRDAKAQSLPQPTISALQRPATPLPARSVSTVQPVPTVDYSSEIPAFTGRLRPVVPQSSNDYVRLSRRYQTSTQNTGLEPKNGASLTLADYSEADAVWNDVSHVQDKIGRTLWDGNERAVDVVRFTLTYQNRVAGFLPLHGQARLMLRECPTELHCQVDVNESEFPLYVDYDRGILYNQTHLKELFEAYNIPAGGIVYLQHVHIKTVRLFWKQSVSSLKNVQLLELQEDGSVEMIEIPEVKYQCEIDEYEVRAEKRLEDPLALFAQALEKGGLFEIMCDVFGDAGRELSYAEIFQGVNSQRRFADGSIRFQLQQRPCFVKLDPDRWSFEPNRGFGFLPPVTVIENLPQSTQMATLPRFNSDPLSGQTNRFDTRSNTNSVSIQHLSTSPYAQVLEHRRNEWSELSLLLEKTSEPKDCLQKFLHLLERLLKRLTQDFSAVNALAGEKDNLFDQLWQKVQHNPNDQQSQTALHNFLLSQTDERAEQIIQQTKSLLAITNFDLREVVFFGLLAQVAEQTAEQNKIEQTRRWYQLLQEQQAGDFSAQLKQLDEIDAIHQVIAAIGSAPNSERWSLCRKSWRQYTGNLQLRKEIRLQIQKKLKQFRARFGQQLTQDEIVQLSEQYRKFLDVLNSIEGVWQKSELAIEVTAVSQRIFEKLVSTTGKPDQVNENLCQAWHLFIGMNIEDQKALPADSRLLSGQTVARKFFKAEDEIAAIAIMEYVKYIIQASDSHVDDKVWCEFYQTLSKYYEQRGLFDFAAKYLNAARQKTPSSQKSQYNTQQSALDEKKKKQAPISREVWQKRCEGLLQEESFCNYVNAMVFKKMCKKLFKEI